MSDQLSRASDTSHEIPQYSLKYARYYQIHVGTTYLILILAIGPVLFTSNVQIYLQLKLCHCNEQTLSQNYQAHIMLQKNWALAIVLLLLKEQMIRDL